MAKMSYRSAVKPWKGDWTKIEDMIDDRFETVDTPLVFNAPQDQLRVVYKGQRWIIYKEENLHPFCLSGCWYTPPSELGAASGSASTLGWSASAGRYTVH